MRIPENLCMLLPKALETRAIKHTKALIADSSGGTKCAPDGFQVPKCRMKKTLGRGNEPIEPQPIIMMTVTWAMQLLRIFSYGIMRARENPCKIRRMTNPEMFNMYA